MLLKNLLGCCIIDHKAIILNESGTILYEGDNLFKAREDLGKKKVISLKAANTKLLIILVEGED